MFLHSILTSILLFKPQLTFSIQGKEKKTGGINQKKNFFLRNLVIKS